MNGQYRNLAELYSVEVGDDGDLYLRVLTGGMAMFVSTIKMDAEMVAQFAADPEGLMPWVRAARRSS
jgi:hypothetical protein